MASTLFQLHHKLAKIRSAFTPLGWLFFLFCPVLPLRAEAIKNIPDSTVKRLIADNNHYIGLYPDGEKNYKSILPLINNYASITDPYLKAEAAYVLGNYYMHVSDSENALRYFTESRTLYRQLGQWGKFLNVTKDYCNLTRMAGNPDIIIPTLKNCLNIARQHDVGFYVLDPLHELAVHLAYIQKDYRESARYGEMFLDTLAKYEHMGIKNPDFQFSKNIDLPILELELGHSYIYLGDAKKAEIFLKRAETAYRGTGEFERLSRLYRYLALLASYAGEQDSVRLYIEKFNYFDLHKAQSQYRAYYQLPSLTRDLTALNEAYQRSQKTVQHLTKQNYYVTAGFTVFVILAVLLLCLYLKSKKDQSRINELLRRDFERVQKLNDEKSRYFSILSHELRTPIFAITGLTRLMQAPEHRTNENFDAIMNSGNHLLHLANNVLQHNKLEESETIRLDEAEFELGPTLAEVLQTVSYLANQRNVSIAFRNELKGPQYLFGDKQKLSQILINLMSNAIRYSHRDGNVEVRVATISTDSTSRTFHFSIRDYGIGIDKSQRPSLFDYHKTNYDFEKDSLDNLKGMGIGLFVVSRFIAAMGSEIKVDSEPGKGSLFHFELRFQLGQRAFMPQKQQPKVDNGYHILVVDDIKVNLIVTLKTVTSLGLKCSVATDSDPVIKIIENESIDLVLMDLNMPAIDGYELTRKIRNAGYFIPVIAHTAIIKENIDHNALAEVGIYDFLVKPYSIEELKAVLSRYLYLH